MRDSSTGNRERRLSILVDKLVSARSSLDIAVNNSAWCLRVPIAGRIWLRPKAQARQRWTAIMLCQGGVPLRSIKKLILDKALIRQFRLRFGFWRHWGTSFVAEKTKLGR